MAGSRRAIDGVLWAAENLRAVDGYGTQSGLLLGSLAVGASGVGGVDAAATVGSYAEANSLGTAFAIVIPGTSTMILGGEWLSNPSQIKTVFHEALHMVFQGGHVAIANALGLEFSPMPGFDTDAGRDLFAAGAINNWINGCGVK
jgi:hypothetical protein